MKLKRYETPAAEMCEGNGHISVMNGVNDLRHKFGLGIVDVRIISPGYGLLDEESLIVPYNYDFKGGDPEIRYRGMKLRIREKIERILPSYDLVFFLLGKKYVTACRLPFRVPNPVSQIFLAPPSWKNTILDRSPNANVVVTDWNELKTEFPGTAPRYLKEAVFERLCRVARDQGLPLFETVKENPKQIIEKVLECNRRR